MSDTAAAASTAAAITPEALLEHWQGHRRLTRRMIEAFPEDQLFTFSIGGMRTFGELSLELLSMAVPMVRGVVSGDWSTSWDREKKSKEEILRMWDQSTDEINTLWAQIPPERFHEQVHQIAAAVRDAVKDESPALLERFDKVVAGDF